MEGWSSSHIDVIEAFSQLSLKNDQAILSFEDNEVHSTLKEPSLLLVLDL